MKSAEQLKAMADEMGISLFQRFSESDSAQFLGISIDTLQSVRSQNKISYLQLEGRDVEYFGYNLLEYILASITNAPASPTYSTETHSILRSKQVTKITGLSRTTIWRLEQHKQFPHRVSLGGGSVGWKSNEVNEWINSRDRV